MAVKSGRLEPLKLFKVFRSLLERRMSGVLTLQRGQVVKQAQIAGGNPLRTASNLQNEGLLWALVEEGLISSTEKLQVEARAAADQVAPEQLVVKLGLVAENRLQGLQRQLHRRRLVEAFGWPDGGFTFEARQLRVEPSQPVIDGVELLIEAGARTLPDAVCERFVQRFEGQFVCPTPLIEQRGAFFDRFFPPPNLRRLVVGPIRYTDLAQAAGQGSRPARQVFALIVSGLASFQSAERAAQIRREMSRPPASAPPPPPQRAVDAALRTPPTPTPQRADAPRPGRAPTGGYPAAPVSGAHRTFEVPQQAARRVSPGPVTGGRQLRAPATPARGMRAVDAGGSFERPVHAPGPRPARSAERPASPAQPRAATPAKGMRAVNVNAAQGRSETPAPPQPLNTGRPVTPAKGMRAVTVDQPEGAPVVAMRGRPRGGASRPSRANMPAVRPTMERPSASRERPAASGERRPQQPQAARRPQRPTSGERRAQRPEPSAQPSRPANTPARGQRLAQPRREAAARPAPKPKRRPSPTAARAAAPRRAQARPKPAAARRNKRAAGAPMTPKAQAKFDQAKALFARLDDATHYDVLGLTKTADADQIRKAFRLLARTYHIDGFARYALSDEDRRLVQQVFIAVNRASEILGDPAKRREYDLGLEAGHTKGQPAGAGVQIDQVFKAERLVRDAVMLIRNGQAPAAVGKLDEALGITPDDLLAKAAKLYADNVVVQSRGSAPQMAVRTRDQLDELLQNYGARDEPFVYLGRLNKALGQRNRAIAAFRKALEINPRCGEAGSELRHLERAVGAGGKSAGGRGDKGKGGGLFGRRKKP